MSLKPAPLYHSGVETASSLLSGGHRGSEIPDFVHSVVVLLFYLVPPLAVRDGDLRLRGGKPVSFS